MYFSATLSLEKFSTKTENFNYYFACKQANKQINKHTDRQTHKQGKQTNKENKEITKYKKL